MLSEFCGQFTKDELPHTVRIGKRWFYDPRGLKRMAEEHGWEVFSAGVFLGEERSSFRPSPALLDLLSERTKQKVAVKEDAAWLVVCGKDVLMEGVDDPGFQPVGTKVLITDMQGNVLGYGEMRSPFDSKAKHRAYVKTLLDRGDYLRRERG